jgi:hypothetical protein
MLLCYQKIFMNCTISLMSGQINNASSSVPMPYHIGPKAFDVRFGS